MNVFKRCFFSLLFFLCAFCRTEGQKLGVVPYACCTTGDAAVDVKDCGDDRLFVLDRSGTIQIINPNGTFRPIPFLDISSKIFVGSDEETLVGLAFSPDYKTNGKFYVNYVGSVAGNPTSIIEEYTVSAADTNIADPSSALTIITQTQPYDIHKGGNLMFDKEGYLFINLGDGGSPEDADGNAQNKTNLLGKILRIDVRNSSMAQPYVIPSSNPFYTDNTPGIRKEIWAYGLRNPWRASIDRLTGDRWFTDVGQNAEEEVDFEAAGSPGG
ncbi:MAG: PQQ-dependent sugar dehydrogenase, partial [Ginsengibacter sp.]